MNASVSKRAWLTAVIGGGEASVSPGEFEGLLEQAREEGVLALLAGQWRMSVDAYASGLAVALQREARNEAAIELSRLARARSVLAALQGAGIDVLVLKGSALAYWLYPQPEWRPRCDLDLLVESREAAQRAVAVLQGEDYAVVADVGVASSAEFEVALQRRSPGGLVHTIDLHWRLVNHASLSRGFTFGELWAGRIPIPKLHAQALGLGRVHALVHALLHRVTNFPSGTQDRLIWLYDIHLLAGGCSEEEWRQFLRLCADKGIATPCLDGLRATRASFSTRIPEVVEAQLQAMGTDEAWQLDAVPDQGEMDRAHLAALSWPDRLGWLRRKLLPSPAFMRYRYGAVGWIGLTLAYLRRWSVGIRRGLGWR